jgi:hypothetical protein
MDSIEPEPARSAIEDDDESTTTPSVAERSRWGEKPMAGVLAREWSAPPPGFPPPRLVGGLRVAALPPPPWLRSSSGIERDADIRSPPPPYAPPGGASAAAAAAAAPPMIGCQPTLAPPAPPCSSTSQTSTPPSPRCRRSMPAASLPSLTGFHESEFTAACRWAPPPPGWLCGSTVDSPSTSLLSPPPGAAPSPPGCWPLSIPVKCVRTTWPLASPEASSAAGWRAGALHSGSRSRSTAIT